MHSPLARRIEEASLNAWPALHQLLYDGWLLRFSRGFTKRANSVNPIYTPASGPDSNEQMLEKVRYCENLYARESQPTVFRLTSLNGQQGLDALLQERDYQQTGHSLVLHLNLADLKAAAPDVPGNSLMLAGMDEWLEIYAALTALPTPARSLHRAILGGIYGQLAMAARSDANGHRIACGLGVLEAELIGLFDIYTHEDARRQGQGGRIVRDLLRWGQTAGAAHGYLQVASDNASALRLYRSMGFGELYRYWYRVSQ